MSWTELVGNALCLDFANSVNRRPDPDRDWLAEPDGLRRWTEHAGLAKAARPATTAEVVTAGELRDVVYRTFSAVAGGKHPAAADLAAITARGAAGLAGARLVPAAGAAPYVLDWAGTPAGALGAVADSALELLRRGPLGRVGECPSCGWLFLDTSRNGRRRWCSMAMCGSQVKSARHYARSAAGAR